MAKLALGVLLMATIYLSTVLLSPQDLVSNAPVYTDDFAMHYAQCLSAQRFFSLAGKCWGYDPFLLAGFPNGALVNADNKAWEVLYCLLSPLIGTFAFKLYLLLFLLSYPFLTYAAARNFSLSRGTSVSASVLGIVYFHLSLPLDFVSWGMVSYVWASYFSLYVLSLFYRLFERFTWTRYLLTTLCASLLLLMHILSPLLLLAPLVMLYACAAPRLSLSRHGAIGLMLLIVLLLNSFWLIPVVQFFQDKTTRPEHYTFALQITNLLEPLKVYLTQKMSLLYRKSPELNNTFIEVMLLLFSLSGFYSWWREKEMRRWLPLAAGAVFLFIIAYYGSYTSFFPQLQPQRFTIPLNILLIIPASRGISLTFHSLLSAKNKWVIFFTLSVTFALLVTPVFKPLKTILRYTLYRLNCEFPPPLHELFNWLNTHTHQGGRILLEDSEYTTAHQHYGGHLPALYPEYVKREFLCGPRPLYPIKHSFASFTEGVLFEKKIEDFSLEELKDYFTLYNVKWIVCWYEKSKNFFNHCPEYITPRGSIDKFALYEVNREPSFFLKGNGKVTSGYNRIALSEITAEEGELIISYHFLKTLITIPERTVERVYRGGDPIGFIRIINPPRSLVIENR